MNTKAPKILNDIVDALKQARVTISEKVEGEGRGGSLKDEGTIKRYLQQHDKFKNNVFDVPPRKPGDMLVKDYVSDDMYVVNIKTSIGSTDNCTSKIGFLYAFTDIPYNELPGSMNWKKFYSLLKDRRADNPNKDYWYLCVDKNDSSNVMIRGAKQINSWCENANFANLLQIDWTKEKGTTPADRTYDEAYEVIINGIVRCLKKGFNNLPEEWQTAIK